MKNIIIEEVGDINFDFSYLEVFFKGNPKPFLEIGISREQKLTFKLYSLLLDIIIDEDEWDYIYMTAKKFLPKAIKNEQDFFK